MTPEERNLQRNLDVMQNIESAIVSVFRERRNLSDYDVMRALDALIADYRAESRGHVKKNASLQEQEAEIFERVRAMCEWRLGRADAPDGGQPAPVAKPLDDVLGCLRKIRKSVDRWHEEGGRQGYLNFVSDYV
ncbi:MAG: hypothetical protein AB1646_19355 [Thermodesulfobacteriota bacterium]